MTSDHPNRRIQFTLIYYVSNFFFQSRERLRSGSRRGGEERERGKREGKGGKNKKIINNDLKVLEQLSQVANKGNPKAEVQLRYEF